MLQVHICIQARTNGTSYFYVITAINSFGESVDSNEVEGITGTPPTLNVAPLSLDFGTTNITKDFYITNTGQGILTWNITDDQTWLNVYSSSGTTTNETDTVTVIVDRASLIRGLYSGMISIGSTTVEVSMYVPNHLPVITSTPERYKIKNIKLFEDYLTLLIDQTASILEYKLKEGLILTEDEYDTIKIDNITIKVLPVWYWLITY